MRLTMTAVGLALGLAAATAAVPAAAQQAQAAAPERKINISKGAQKAVVELQNAVNAKDAATIPAKLAAAQAAAKTGEDRYYIGNLQLRAGIAATDYAMIASGIEAMLASGVAQPDELATLHLNRGKAYNNLKQYDQAVPALQQAIQLTPNDVDAMILLAEIQNTRGQTAEAVGLIQQAIKVRAAAGQKAEESWYKRAVALAYNAKLPASVGLGRDWAKAYPTAANWRDALRIYRRLGAPDEATTIDLFRLSRAAKALSGEGDYYEYASLLNRKGFAGEAKAVLDEGFAAGVDRNKPEFKSLAAQVATRAQGDRAALDASVAGARSAAGPNAAIAAADAYYGYGDYAKAADLYRVALGKSGADANLINLRLGMALAGAGDKAAAATAFNAVTGPRAELARFWLGFLGAGA